MRTRVCIIEDDFHTRQALSDQLSRSHQFMWHGSAATLNEAQMLVSSGNFDLAILDLDLFGASSLHLIAPIIAKGAQVLVLTKMADEQSIMQATQAGASGYILKDDALIDLTAAISSVLQGEAPISPAVASVLLRRLRNAEPAAPAELSKRETEVLVALSEGLTYQEIASRHHLSYHTVSDHTKSIYRKLKVNSRGQAVAK
ncbi:MAG: response regulator transcription factor, partial [Pseudomonadota bacterium]